MQGIPKGLSSDVPGFGIITRRVGLDFLVRNRCFTRSSRWVGVRDFIPSTPAVFFPALSCVTRLTANPLGRPGLHQ